MADFSALHVALSGLRAAQLRMDTASHNVSNANTPGYTRQRVDLASRYPRLAPEGQIGLGVDVTDISRIRDGFLDTRYRSSLSISAGLDARTELLRRAERITGEPDQGITSELSALWDAFEDLALDPTDRASRFAVLEQLSSVTGRVNDVATGFERLGKDAHVSLLATIDEVNGILEQVAQLNTAILEASASPGTPNDLMDQRDLLIDRLSELAGVSVMYDGDRARVSIGGISLVDGSNWRPLSFDSATGQVRHPSGVAVVPGGEAGGLLSAITKDLPNLRAQLDAFVTDLADSINTIHQAGYTATGSGGPLLAFDSSAPAISLSVTTTDPDAIATAGTLPFAPFDASIPQQLADLRTARVAVGGTASLGDVMRGFIANLGQETAAAVRSAETQRGLADSADLARMSSHGVSTDEEMVQLMEAQRMYEAAARVITAVDEALATLIHRTGVVGR